jgi:hypothetical protein
MRVQLTLGDWIAYLGSKHLDGKVLDDVSLTLDGTPFGDERSCDTEFFAQFPENSAVEVRSGFIAPSDGGAVDSTDLGDDLDLWLKQRSVVTLSFTVPRANVGALKDDLAPILYRHGGCFGHAA